MRNCVFCGGPANSREHVLAKRLCKRAKAETMEIIVGKMCEEDGVTKRPTHPLDELKVRRVCRDCNSGWMNDLEGWFERRLGYLIEPEWPKLADATIEFVKNERVQLARWLMKTAVTMNLSSMVQRMFPDELTLQLSSGYIPPSTYVDMGYSKLTTVACLLSQGFQVINGGHYHSNQIHRDKTGFRFTVQFNHLLLRIYRIPEATATFWSHRGERPIMLYPNAIRTNPAWFEYEDIMAYDHNLVLETAGKKLA